MTNPERQNFIRLFLAKEQREISLAMDTAARIVRGIGPETDTGQTITLLRNLRKRAERGLHLSAGLISWEKQGPPRPVALAPQLMELQAYYQRLIARKSLQLHIDLTEKEQVLTDPAVQLFINRHLLGNALRYAPMHSTIRISIQRSNGRIALSYQDEGAGIDLKGLGLSICQAMLAGMDGKLYFSSPNTITYELPAAP